MTIYKTVDCAKQEDASEASVIAQVSSPKVPDVVDEPDTKHQRLIVEGSKELSVLVLAVTVWFLVDIGARLAHIVQAVLP